MDLNGVIRAKESYSASYESRQVTVTVREASKAAVSETAAATYEKGAETPVKNSKIDYATIDKLKADAEERTASLRSLVEKMFSKQANTFLSAEGELAAMYRGLQVDPEVSAQAQKDIAEDGYWGIEQTSERILSFAKALAGDDAKLANDMLEAIRKGFGLAEKDWGEELPELSQKTMETTLNKVNDWIASLGGNAVADTQAAGAGSEITITYSEQKSSFSASTYIETSDK